MPVPSAVTLTVYRELLRSTRRLKSVMGPGHVVLVGECARRFAETTPMLAEAIKERGESGARIGAIHLPPDPADLVKHIFRNTSATESPDKCIDDAFRALRTLSSIENYWIKANDDIANANSKLGKYHEGITGVADQEASV